MDNIPLLHEPGFTDKHQDVERYNKIIFYKNFDFCVNNIMLEKIKNSNKIYTLFKEEIINEFKKNKKAILIILEKKQKEEKKIIKTGIYNMNIGIDWENTYKNFIKIKV